MEFDSGFYFKNFYKRQTQQKKLLTVLVEVFPQDEMQTSLGSKVEIRMNLDT